jgi:hypothetical protein
VSQVQSHTRPVSSRLGWYARRLSRMSPAEAAWRVRDQALRRAWARRQVSPGQQLPWPPWPAAAGELRFTSVLPSDAASRVPAAAVAAITEAADRLLGGEWEMLGITRADMKEPDWFHDPVTGRRSAPGKFAFRIDQRAEDQVGNVKQVWEVNRLQHLTLLAAAWYLTGRDDYAERVDSQLRSWWRENPFLSGVNWTSGIELGVRLINWAWIRRLLDGWPGVADLFELNDLAVRQIHWHQQYLAAFESRGSSANNHVIAEAAGQLAASCAFPWFGESARWRARSAGLLERELERNTFPSGVNRELASDYHGFVAELGFFAAVEAQAAGAPLGPATLRRLCAMTDAMAALVDERLRPPRQGDSDEGRVVLLDPPEHNRWPTLLAIGGALFGRLDWWPPTPADAAAVLVRALAGPQWPVSGRPAKRPSRFADAGLTILRTGAGTGTGTGASADAGPPEIWCRCDGGPHGFLSIAAHAHADALSVEVRHGGVDILADPGTYCYHGEQEWRTYFQSTIGHNALEIDGRWQSDRGGAFLWLRHANGTEISVVESGPVTTWTASHDGYLALKPPATHRRTARMDAEARTIELIDEIGGGPHSVRLAYHLGPEVSAALDGSVASLSWPGRDRTHAALLELPGELSWSLHRGETSPILGWYSAGLGHRVPTFTLLGEGRYRAGIKLMSLLRFIDAGKSRVLSGQAISLGAFNGASTTPETHAEGR